MSEFKKEDYYVDIVNKSEIREWILKKHYAHRMPSTMFSYGLFDKDKTLQGVCILGMPPCHFNYGAGIFDDYKVDTYELTRLVINDNMPRNSLSFFVSKVLNIYLPSPSCIVSFADPNNNHHGYIYQATNWLYTGVSQKGGKDKQWIFNEREYHAKTITVEWMKKTFPKYDDSKNMTANWIANGGEIEENPLCKFRYLYFIGNKKQKKEMRNHLTLPILSYPKGENKRYDASYTPDIQERLF